MKISLTNLTTVDLATLAKRTIESSESGKYTVVENHPLLLELKKEYADYQLVYSKMSSSGMGETVQQADLAREKLFGELKNYLEGVAGLRAMEGRDEAAELLKLFVLYGKGIAKMSYSTESAQLKKLLDDLAKPENAARAAKLKISAQVAELKALQEHFEELFGTQAEANADLRQLPSASAIRKSLEGALRDYLSLLESMKKVEDWKMLYLDINEVVKAAANSHKPTDSGTNATEKPVV